jgi:hypothetical protein
MQYKLHVWLRKTARRGFPESYRTGRSREKNSHSRKLPYRPFSGKKFTFSKATVPGEKTTDQVARFGWGSGMLRLTTVPPAPAKPAAPPFRSGITRQCTYDHWVGGVAGGPHGRHRLMTRSPHHRFRHGAPHRCGSHRLYSESKRGSAQ